MGIIGIIVLLAIAFALSKDRSAIKLRTVAAAFGIQAVFGAFVLYVPFGQALLEALSRAVQTIIDSSQAGMDFLFGALVSDQMFDVFEGGGGFVFALRVLPIIVFFSSLIAVLYYLGIMQRVIEWLGGALQKMLGISRPEALSATANIFVGLSEAPLVVRPYIANMTQSQLFAVMAGGTATVAGSVLVGYAGIGIELKYLLAASFMAAPGGLLMAKIMVPETETPIDSLDQGDVMAATDQPVNLLDAAASGATSGMKLAINVGAMLLAFISLIALTNIILSQIGGLAGLEQLTLQQILGYAFSPLAYVIGIPWSEAAQAGSLIGQKFVINEFVAYADFITVKDALSPNAQTIITFALCGFANLPAIAVLLGGIGGIAPSRRHDLARLGIRSVIAGTLANLMSATLAGLFIAL